MCKRISNKDTLSDQHEESNPTKTAHTVNNTKFLCDIPADQLSVAILAMNGRFLPDLPAPDRAREFPLCAIADQSGRLDQTSDRACTFLVSPAHLQEGSPMRS